MLSLLNPPSTLNTFLNTKCAEIYCQTLDHFSIVCSFCELKSFDFDDFLLHFKNVHFNHNKTTTEVAVKREDMVTSNDTDGAVEFQEQLQDISELMATPEPVDVIENFEPATMEVNLTWSEVNEFSDADNNTNSDGDNDKGEDKEFLPKIFRKVVKKTPAANHKCAECGKSYKLARFLEHHMDKCHNKDRTHKCPRCDSEFRSERSLNSHVQSIHEGFSCDQCDKVYKSKEALQLHAFNHSGVRSFICDVENCGKAFFNRKHLSCHKRIVHTLERNYICEMCGFRTKVKPALIVHKRSHTGEKPFACKDCDRRFASQSLLGEHRAMHSNERPHKCEVCGAAFSRAKALYHHKHLHLGVKKYKCKICNKAYAQAAGLSGHMRQHKTEQL